MKAAEFLEVITAVISKHPNAVVKIEESEHDSSEYYLQFKDGQKTVLSLNIDDRFVSLDLDVFLGSNAAKPKPAKGKAAKAKSDKSRFENL